LDGVSAAIMAGEIVKNAGGKVAAYYFPNRENEGYGITPTALENLAPLAPALLVAVDLGIGNFREVKLARAAGFSTVIIDHHEILDGIPEADIIVDPKQPEDVYPFKFFSAAGLVFKLAEEFFGADFYGSLRQSFAELAALATIADMMPREADNIDIVEEGLSAIKQTFRPGLRAFFDTDAFFENDSRNFNNRLNRIIAVLNVRDMRGGVPAAFELLTTDSLEKSEGLIKEFLEINKIRRQKIDGVVEEIKIRVGETNRPIIFEGSPDWDLNLLGTVASILNNDFKKPVFIYKKLENESQGTVRSTEAVDSVALMKNCKDLLITFGGHPKASGFRIVNENLEGFKQCLINNLKK
jgi:single-stranded-DNA-specific exonuclease